MSNKIVVGITQGDSNSISYEVIIKALTDARILEICTPVIYGSSKLFGYYKKQINDADGIVPNVISAPSEIHHKRVNIINCVPESVTAEPGRSTTESSRGAFLSLEKAINHIKNGEIDVLVTGPFNKASMKSDGFIFPGHTEYLTKEFQKEDSLMFMIFITKSGRCYKSYTCKRGSSKYYKGEDCKKGQTDDRFSKTGLWY